MQNEAAGSKSEFTQLESTNAELRAKIEDFKLKNAELKAKTSSLNDINALLQKQLDIATTQIRQQHEFEKSVANAESEKPIKETIQALRGMESFITTPFSADEYRQKLQNLKAVLDEGTINVTNEEFKNKITFAYKRYQVAYSVIVWSGESYNVPLENGLKMITTAFTEAGIAVPSENSIALMRGWPLSQNSYVRDFWADAKKSTDEAEALIKN